MRRPHNRFGVLMTAVGFAWFLSGLTESNDAWVYTLGVYLGAAVPRARRPHAARLPRRAGSRPTAQRTLIAIGYLTAFLVQLPFFLLGGDIGRPRQRARATPGR